MCVVCVWRACTITVQLSEGGCVAVGIVHVRVGECSNIPGSLFVFIISSIVSATVAVVLNLSIFVFSGLPAGILQNGCECDEQQQTTAHAYVWL